MRSKHDPYFLRETLIEFLIIPIYCSIEIDKVNLLTLTKALLNHSELKVKRV